MDTCKVTFTKENPSGDGKWRIFNQVFEKDKPVEVRADVASFIKGKHGEYIKIEGQTQPWKPPERPKEGAWDEAVRLPGGRQVEPRKLDPLNKSSVTVLLGKPEKALAAIDAGDLDGELQAAFVVTVLLGKDDLAAALKTRIKE